MHVPYSRNDCQTKTRGTQQIDTNTSAIPEIIRMFLRNNMRNFLVKDLLVMSISEFIRSVCVFLKVTDIPGTKTCDTCEKS